jgi:hypothetical protein
MAFNVIIIVSCAFFLISVYLAYRGVKKGTAAYHKRGIFVGFLLLFFWAAIRAYFYLRYGSISLNPVHIPILALAFIVYSAFRWFRLPKASKENA